MIRPGLQSPRLRRALAKVALILLLAIAAWIASLDQQIRSQLDGRRWALPARVYARPLDLYAGLAASRADVVDELNALGYQRVEAPAGPGQYAVVGESLRIITRGFKFWDGPEPSQPIALSFSGRQLSRLARADGTPLALERLEPVEIARIYPTHNEDRVLLRIAEVPKNLILSLLAAEDKNFYRHFGIDPIAVARATFENLRAGGLRQGGSTLTQQLVKNFYLNAERTVARKVNEAIMALILEWRYTKQEILEVYLNEVYLGQDGPRAIHGFALASLFYFGRPLQELRLDQMALLAGLVRGASLYNPRRHAERARARRDHVLTLMVKDGMLSDAQAKPYLARPLDVIANRRLAMPPYPAFLELVRRQLRAFYKEEDLRSAGLQIFTTLDPALQERAEHVLPRRIKDLEARHNVGKAKLQGALIVASTQTGEVQAIVADRNPRYPGFNRALDAKRPIGSLVKPMVYLTALSRPWRYHVMTPLQDAPVRLIDERGRPWFPKNYDNRLHGSVSLRTALAKSYNLATLRLGLDVGVKNVSRTLKLLGVTGSISEYPSLLLGSVDLSPLQVTQIYQTMASGGFYSPLRAIREVVTGTGEPLHRYALSVRQRSDPAATYLIKYLMTEVAQSGTASRVGAVLRSAMPLAGKTGTTNDLRDSWFVGFGEDLLASVWLGRDDNLSTGLSGASGALEVWLDLMREHPPRRLAMGAPAGIGWYWVDDRTGLATTAACPGARRYPFIAAHAPGGFAPCPFYAPDLSVGPSR
ncbi:MAG: penicillin-binding protein 1B [Gammaproteobacteria bacterium]